LCHQGRLIEAQDLGGRMVGYEAGGRTRIWSGSTENAFAMIKSIYLESLSNDEWPCVVAEI
jgi:hypothetical protein